jgi:hypothetical protein
VVIDGQNVTQRRAYSSISSQFARATPTTTKLSDYTSTNPFPKCTDIAFEAGRDGPINITEAFTINSTIPNPPYPPLCHCMARTLSCVANPTYNISTSYLAMRRACAANPAFCTGIESNGRTGFYSSYRFCNLTERAGWAVNQQYLAAGGSDPAACAAAGGVLQAPTPARLAGPDCETLLRQAGPAGTGTITFTPGLRAGGDPRGGGGGGGTPVGSVVGGVLGAVAAVALAAGLALRHRARRKRERRRLLEAEEAAGGGQGGAAAGGALPAEAKVGAEGDAAARELDGTEQVEIDGNETFEMGDNGPLELDSAQDELFELEGEGSVGGVASGPVSPLTVAGTPKSATTWAEGTH